MRSHQKQLESRIKKQPVIRPQPRAEREVKLAAVIPVKGRESLLQKTIRRLHRQTLPVFSIICLGETESERAAVREAGGVFVYHKNYPLGAKWQHGIDVARSLGATDILIVGSSDWITDRWCEIMAEQLWKGYDLIGKKDIFFLDVAHCNKKKMAYWRGYNQDNRADEPIGAGRIISREILQKTNWQMFDNNIDNSLDWSTYTRVKAAGGFVKTLETTEAFALSIGCYKWVNKHQWHNLIINPMTIDIKPRAIDTYLRRYFPDAINVFGEE